MQSVVCEYFGDSSIDSSLQAESNVTLCITFCHHFWHNWTVLHIFYVHSSRSADFLCVYSFRLADFIRRLFEISGFQHFSQKRT